MEPNEFRDKVESDIARLERKIDVIGNQLNFVVDTVTKFVTAIGSSPMARMLPFGPKEKDTVHRG